MADPLPAKVVPDPLSQQNFEALERIREELEKQIEEAEAGPEGATKAELEAEEKERAAKDKTEKEAREAADALKQDAATAATDAELATEKSERESKDNERVVGPAGATDLDVAVFNGVTGKVIKDGGKTVAQLLARANHTGTQTASTISDLAAVVKAYLLNEFGKPGANVDINEKKLIKVADPTEALDAANKEYVDAAASAAAAGLSVKNPVSYASTANIASTAESTTTLEGETPLVIDGKEAFAEGTRILLKDQTAKKQNGIYEVTFDEAFGGSGTYGGSGTFGSGSKWKLTRTTDADTTAEVKQGMFVTVVSGTTNAGSAWVLQTENPIEIGITNEEFARFTASPTGVAGGDLTGTFPNPTIGESKVEGKHVKDESLEGKDLKEGTVEGKQIKNETIENTDIKKETIADDRLVKRSLWGSVTSAGAVNLGSGFTAEKLGVGSYKINFTTAFNNIPIVLGTVDTINGMIRIFEVTKTACRIGIVNKAEEAKESAFQFSAREP